MEEGLDIIQKHLSSFWNWTLGIMIVVGGFLISKKAILAGLYYLLNLLKIFVHFIKNLFTKKKAFQARKKALFWDTDLTFKEALHQKQMEKEEEFYHWLQFLLTEGEISEEQMLRIPLFSIFIQYSVLHTLAEKQTLAQKLIRELKEGTVRV